MTTQTNNSSSPVAAIEGPPTLGIEGAVATIKLRRPSQRNSLHDEDLHTLFGYFSALETDLAVRVLVLEAETAAQGKPVFSAGYFIGGFNSGHHDPTLFEKIPDALENLRPLTVCALGGSVYGGATDVALACDFRVGLAGCEFRMPAAALGLHYYPTGMRRYVERLGANATRRAFLTAQGFSYEQLQGLGVVEVVDSADAFAPTVKAFAEKLAGLAPLATQSLKQSINEIANGRFDQARLRERERVTQVSQDFAEGRAAFAARRPPRFTGT